MATDRHQSNADNSSKEKWSDANPSLETVKNDTQFIQRFRELYNSEVFSDIILRVGNERFFAHKFMLITASEVFDAMLNEARWRESRQPEISLTEEEECQPVFSKFLRYIYTGSVDLTTDTVLPILLLSDKYGIQTLHQSSVEYMARHIVESPNTNRTLSWYQYAKMTGNQELQDKCSQFILSNFDIILKATDWVELTKEEVVEFLSSSDILVNSEMQLWLHLEKWLMHESRVHKLDEYLQKVLPLIHFTMIPPKQLLQIEESPLCLSHRSHFSEKLSLAYRHHSLLFDQVESAANDEPFRNYTAEEYGIYHDFSLLNYTSVSKIESKIFHKFSVPLRFISQAAQKNPSQMVSFEVTFYPKGYYTTFNLYGHHIGRQTDNVGLHIRRTSTEKLVLPVMGIITFIIYGMNNGVRYVAFTHTMKHIFTQDDNAPMEEKDIFPLKNLTQDNSPYLINGNLDAKVFIKVQNVVEFS
ncbi:hypothetical protein CHS0354_034168 [Potamilus streckersoni]|nr:hypothetical protein CHS0354_034168 [Potamilus streckersoni]